MGSLILRNRIRKEYQGIVMSATRALFRQVAQLNKVVRAAPCCKRVTAKCLTTSCPLYEQITHTGQKYDEGDWKQVRFVDGRKLVSKNFAQDLVAEEPIVEVSERVVRCNGADGALGHPKVFINLDKPGVHVCGYCGRRFMRKVHH